MPKTAKTITVKLYGTTFELGLIKSKYKNNDTLYLGLYDVNDNEHFCDLTVNMPDSSAAGTIQYVNTDDFPQLEEIIKQYSLGIHMGPGRNGNPMYWFNPERIRDYIVHEIA